MTSLPGPEFTALIRPHTGDVTAFRPTARGNNSAITALVKGDRGEFFVKAVPNRPGGRRDSLVREGLINRHVQPISPAICWQAESPAWIALGFETVQGRHADFTPGSADLPAVVDTIARIGALDLPDIARDWPETRWDGYTDDAAAFRGDTLLYTDINPDNFLIGHRTWAVDWAWPTRGAAWIDPALLTLQLIAAGHLPGQAEDFAACCPGWAAGGPQAVDAFALANQHMYQHLADRTPDAPWLNAMTTAARNWAEHRGARG